MTSKIIKPKRETLIFDGKMTYCEAYRAWAIARFKSPLLREFSQLKNRGSRFNYKAKLCFNYKELEKEIREIKKKKGVIPILLHFEQV